MEFTSFIMKNLDVNLTGLQISILEDPISNPDQLDIRGLNFGYIIILIGGKYFSKLDIKFDL